MTLYYFDVNECGDMTIDDDGHACTDWEEALDWAVGIARGIMAAEVAMGRLCLDCSVEIRDEKRELLHVMPFSYAIKVTGATV